MTNVSTPSDSPDVDSCVRIGSIVSSNSHLDYVAEVYKDRDCDRPPELHEREFGQPVFIKKTVDGTEHVIVGVIYDTQLVDPDQGRTGPRLAQDDQAQFTPGYIEERTTLVGIALLGTAVITDDRTIADPSHQMPRWTLEVDDTVYHCPDQFTEAFHRVDGQIQLAYLDRLVDIAGDLGAEVIVTLIDRLRGVLPEDDSNQRVLDVVEQNVQWQAREQRGVV
ncbi:hypothetical protein SAMN05443661_15314 [Natronobacterium gregoryi]|uniref:DUF8166 domain-containing protein n=2 Tax=Natronobacterium gregoryi TaxID=44930 RepID=L0AKS4_NATGS|nr:hypothetical protein Natgr_2628 [Natronobacterium gregoryi SP2]SFJ65860.1 hypothetical protein SAMN05443661_15314 [Natronobacterium gregoryi]